MAFRGKVELCLSCEYGGGFGRRQAIISLIDDFHSPLSFVASEVITEFETEEMLVPLPLTSI